MKVYVLTISERDLPVLVAGSLDYAMCQAVEDISADNKRRGIPGVAMIQWMQSFVPITFWEYSAKEGATYRIYEMELLGD